MNYYETWPLPHANVSIQSIGSMQIGVNIEDLDAATTNYGWGYDEASGQNFVYDKVGAQQPLPIFTVMVYFDAIKGTNEVVESVWMDFGSTHPQRPNK